MQIRNYTIDGESRNHNAEFFADLIAAGGQVISLRSLPYQKVNITIMVPEVGIQLAYTPVAEFVIKYKDCEEIR